MLNKSKDHIKNGISLLNALLIRLVVILLSVNFVYADDEKKEDDEKEPTLKELIEEQTLYDGLFTIIQDPEDGSGLFILNENMLDQHFIYQAKTVEGVVSVGHFRGHYRDNKLIKFERYFDRIDVIHETNRFYFDPDSAISKASDANKSDAVLASLEIKHEEDGLIAVDLQKLVKSEELSPVKPFPSRDSEFEKRRFKLGKLSSEKSRVAEIRNFPENTHIVVDFVYENMAPKNFGGPEQADSRFTTISLQHAFIALPDNNFKPRRDDPRVGYFTQTITDLTSEETANYRDLIERWHLEKKDPSAELSEPVEPITWWIENTTPLEWREIVKEGVLAWNEAFETAGFKNAIVVRTQPDNADWEADDVRYNVLRWTSSPRPPFGGYGPSITNPLTGQIVASDIMLEYIFLKNRWIYDQMFTDGIASTTPNLVTTDHEQDEHSLVHHDHLLCSKGANINHGVMLSRLAGLGTGKDLDDDEILRQALLELILHEVGHTLGLNHNMMASQLHNSKDVHDKQKTNGVISSSVMDYHPPNIAPVGKTQGDYYNTKTGPWDNWIIKYGYSQGLDDPEAEERRLQEILALSTLPEHAFGNDADDMRAPGRHIDPRVNINDMSNEAIEYARDRFELIAHTAGKLPERVLQKGESHQDLLVGANFLFGEFRNQARTVSRYIGGIYINRAMVGQEGYTKPYTPVELKRQKLAMEVLSEYVFAPDVIEEMSQLYAFLQPQRRGFKRYGRNEDPKIHDMLLAAQKQVLDHIMHPNVTQRIVDSALYGNKYSLTTMMDELTEAIFDEDIDDDVNTFRQNLQVEYVERLIDASGLENSSDYDNQTKAIAIYQLEEIMDMADNSGGGKASEIHKDYLVKRIELALGEYDD